MQHRSQLGYHTTTHILAHAYAKRAAIATVQFVLCYNITFGLDSNQRYIGAIKRFSKYGKHNRVVVLSVVF